MLAGRDACELARKWGVTPGVMQRIVQAANLIQMQTRAPVWITSGYRTREQQERLKVMGRPTAPDSVSTHRSCPATGVDISLGALPTREKKQVWGALVQLEGLRWGGGSQLDEHGIPSDWQHIDAGPRFNP